jgi:UDP-3-O-[3-hydroxymyristoyl] N-acetylglucosamine deacetylase
LVFPAGAHPEKVRSTCTIVKKVVREGLGLFTGAPVKLELSPLPKGSGVLIQRVDLPDLPKCPLQLSLVQGTPRCTVIGNDRFSVQTVEHLMAALYAYEVTDLLIQVSGPEIPIFDGSSQAFVEMLQEAGLQEQGSRPVYQLKNPVYWSKENVHIVAIPSQELRISYTLHYPSCKGIGTQFYSSLWGKENFEKEIAPCRTFSVYEEIAPLMEKGFLKGGSLENAVVFKEDRVMNAEGLRFADEMVRHKILDMMGDLYLMGVAFSAHIIAIRSGHYANNAFAHELLTCLKKGGGNDDSR